MAQGTTKPSILSLIPGDSHSEGENQFFQVALASTSPWWKADIHKTKKCIFFKKKYQG